MFSSMKANLLRLKISKDAKRHPQRKASSSRVEPPEVNNFTTGMNTPIISDNWQTACGMFNGANNSTLINPTMISHSKISFQIPEDGGPVLLKLAQHMNAEAELDSFARHPPPKCHPGTRTTLTADIKTWLDNDQRQWDMLWLHGPAGVGKSAVAQTIAEYCQELGCLGAAFFFSRPNERNDPNCVIPTLAYQIAVRIPEYRVLVGRQLGDDPMLMTKTLHIQFKKLLVEPLTSLSSAQLKKILIVLDGLDECKGKMAQRELVELVNKAAMSNQKLPVLWMICSRPEYHLKTLFARVDSPVCCWKVELPIDHAESKEDVELYLRESFRNIYEEHGDIFGEEHWPPEEHIKAIVLAASGLFVFASTLIKFVEDSKNATGIERRLETVMRVLKRSHAVGARNPMVALDQLYTQIMSEIPEDILLTTTQILGLHFYNITNTRVKLNPLSIANHLDLTASEFHEALHNLHSVVQVPEKHAIASEPLKLYHTSFSDYLQDPVRSGKFFPDAQAIAYTFLKNHLKRVEVESTNGGKPFEFAWSNSSTAEQKLKWSDSMVDQFKMIADNGSLFREYEDSKMLDLFDLIRRIDPPAVCFHPQHDKQWVHAREYRVFARYIKWLYTSETFRKNLPNFVRIPDASDSKPSICLSKCLAKCTPIVPLSSKKTAGDDTLWRQCYFLMGHGESTRLVVVYDKQIISHCMQTHQEIRWTNFGERALSMMMESILEAGLEYSTLNTGIACTIM